ncbi:MAG TPA: FAD-binding oxidoreductase [Dehalococcoidia bacterium]|nr:FAD-binding oxidoreductase [Dehalococcoidia bacterium]
MTDPAGVVVNDIHSQLNPTRVSRIVSVDSVEAIQAAIAAARREGRPICVAGGRHAMGGQQFASGGVLVDTTPLNRVLSFDSGRGVVEAEAGIRWPALIEALLVSPDGQPPQWGIAQKQTGADRLSLGGALAANAHGRGLRMKPLIADVDSFVLIDAEGAVRTCRRRENSELFRLAIGGYGLFGVISSVRLRLAPRQKLQRVVEVVEVGDLLPTFEQRIADGFLYGDFQFAIDERSDDFLRKGIFSCYRPIDPATPIPDHQRQLSDSDWWTLLTLAHQDRAQAYRVYRDHYLATSGQIYWSDLHQLSTYIDDYHRRLDVQVGESVGATEVITEVYVPRPALVGFLDDARDDLQKAGVPVIYGTIRLIERDDESFLAWARQPYACVIFNLHTRHSPDGLEDSAAAFRRLIDRAVRRGGSYYLTYHRYATRDQLEACYPPFADFLRLKRTYDPEERFQSEWYRHYKQLFD